MIFKTAKPHVLPQFMPSVKIGLLAATLVAAHVQAAPISPMDAYINAAKVSTPADVFGPLYAEVESRNLLGDSKTFADAVPKLSSSSILAAYRRGIPWTDVSLRAFIEKSFDLPAAVSASAVSARQATPIDAHINQLWSALTRPPLAPVVGSSALSLPKSYVVPGGRFREIYYWDSYFTMLGLKRDGEGSLVEDMIDDFGSMIDRYGHIPNGSRTYYLSRSQPPLFYAMVGLSQSHDPAVRRRQLTWMEHEYAFWMVGARGLKPGEARLHVVALPDGGVLNRYFDARATPRDESYREDAALAARSRRSPQDLYRDIRAAAESGWDFSSRWMSDGKTLGALHTTDLVPPDLNSLLFGLEKAIAAQCHDLGDTACANAFGRKAQARADTMRRWLWDDADGLYRDYDWRTRTLSPTASAATLYPLFVGLASNKEATRIANYTRSDLLAPGGLRTTAIVTGQQWDAPNGWAPLQWIAVEGLERYGQTTLGQAIACRWLANVQHRYEQSGKLVEKYDVEHQAVGGGGEYPLQDGFGWTNGVVRALEPLCPASSGAS
ncbi:MAG: alpha,alpha-trehalase TreF [Caulobacteraceae bacterium]